MSLKLNAAFRLTADEAIAPAESFRDQNEEGLKDRQKDVKKTTEDMGKEPAPTTAEADEAEGEGEEGAGDTTISMDIPQSTGDDDVSVDASLPCYDDKQSRTNTAAAAFVASSIKRLTAEEAEVDAEADPKLFNTVVTQPVGAMS